MMLYSLEDVRRGWSVRVVAGIRRAPTREEWKHGGVAFGEKQLHVIAVIRKVHPRPFLDPPKGTKVRFASSMNPNLIQRFPVRDMANLPADSAPSPADALDRKPAAPIE